MKKKILAMYKLPSEGQMEKLGEMFEIVSIRSAEEAQTIIDLNKDHIVAILGVIGRPIGAGLMQMLPNLEIISSFGVGTDHIDLSAARDRHIAVTNTPDLVTNDTADIALSLMLSVSRRIVEADMFVRVGRWLAGSMPLGTSLTGKTVGIIGLGNIGKAIAKRAAAFDMEVAYTATAIKQDQPYTYYETPEKLAAASDYLIVACPGGESTKNLVDKKVLQALGTDGYLINIARGSVVSEEDLIWALDNHVIAGAGLDVYSNEPHVPQELLGRDNVVLLPHIGTATTETRTKMGDLVLENLRCYFQGEPLPSQIL